MPSTLNLYAIYASICYTCTVFVLSEKLGLEGVYSFRWIHWERTRMHKHVAVLNFTGEGFEELLDVNRRVHLVFLEILAGEFKY